METKLQGYLFNTSVTNDTDMFSEITPKWTRSTFVLNITLETAGVVSFMETQGATVKTNTLNDGTALDANENYTFSWPVVQNTGASSAPVTYNVQTDTSATASRVMLLEVRDA